MNCRQAEQLLSEQQDRPLAGRETAALEAHLEQCRPCRRLRDEHRAVAAALRVPVEPFPLPDLPRRAIARWSEPTQAPHRAGPWAPRLRPAPAAGLLLLLLGARVARWSPEHPRPSPSRLAPGHLAAPGLVRLAAG